MDMEQEKEPLFEEQETKETDVTEERLELMESYLKKLYGDMLALEYRMGKLEEPPKEEKSPPQGGNPKSRAFLGGVAAAWVMVSLGALGLLAAWRCLGWMAAELNIPVTVLLSLVLLFALALQLQSKGAALAAWLAKWMEPEDL